MKKILFLDIDGVVNCATTSQRHRGTIGIDPYMALLVDRIIQATGCGVVISSSWRHSKERLDEIRKQACEFTDITPSGRLTNYEDRPRGHEIRKWLDRHSDVERVDRYAILDDDSDMLDEQLPSFFKTSWQTGLTQEIADKVIAHLNK